MIDRLRLRSWFIAAFLLLLVLFLPLPWFWKAALWALLFSLRWVMASLLIDTYITRCMRDVGVETMEVTA